MLPPAPALLPPAVNDEDDEDIPSQDPGTPVRRSDKPIKASQTRADTLDARTSDVLGLALKKMSEVKLPPVHDYPAPWVEPSQGDPTLPHPRPPSVALVGVRQSYFQRFIHSSSGRFAIFAFTLACVNISILGLVSWNSPTNRAEGSSYMWFLFSLVLFSATFTMPLLAERGGMSAKDTGWKPWLILYRISFVLAIPACVCQVLGKGAEISFGTSSGKAGDLQLTKLANNYWDYFELVDGFVALNLTKGVTETLIAEEHGVKKHRRVSRFRDAELRVNTEPYSDEVEPTETPGRLATYRVAPVFEHWNTCLARYRMSTGCLQQNPIIAWAISKSDTLCSRQKSVGCRPPKPKLEPMYKCSQLANGTRGVAGVGLSGPIEGLCGHVTAPPPDGAVDELGALLLYDAWPKISLPNATTMWLDVMPDECLRDTATCKANWSTLYLAGLVFQIVTNLCIVLPMYWDCRLDTRIRKARKYVEEQETKARNAGQSLVK